MKSKPHHKDPASPTSKRPLSETLLEAPPIDDTPEATIESFYGSEEDTALAEIKLYGSTKIKPGGRSILTESAIEALRKQANSSEAKGARKVFSLTS